MSQSRHEMAQRNQEAINADLIRQLAAAPSDLYQIYRTEGFDGVIRWTPKWQDLCDAVIRVHWLGLLLEETRQEAIAACDQCLGFRITVDTLNQEAMKVKTALG